MNLIGVRSAEKLDCRSELRRAVFRFVPALDSLRTYSLRALTRDTMAGLTVAAVTVPQAPVGTS